MFDLRPLMVVSLIALAGCAMPNANRETQDMDIIHRLEAEQIRINAEHKAGRITDAEADARWREALANAEGEMQHRGEDRQMRRAITNREHAQTQATYTDMIERGVRMMEGPKPVVATCSQWSNTATCVAR